MEFDPGPPPGFLELFERAPDYAPHREHFWFDWGPIFYRGRLDGTAKLLVVASDPGPTERLARRSLVGHAGQRVQGFLQKLGLTRSYVCLNAFVYGFFPSHFEHADAILGEAEHTSWRNEVFDLVRTPALQAVVAFGSNATIAVRAWPGRGTLPVVEVHHPSFPIVPTLLAGWRDAIETLRDVVTADPDGDVSGANYGQDFVGADYAPIPRRDLPFGAPWFLGDDRWAREAEPPRLSSVEAAADDFEHALVWHAPDGSAA